MEPRKINKNNNVKIYVKCEGKGLCSKKEENKSDGDKCVKYIRWFKL